MGIIHGKSVIIVGLSIWYSIYLIGLINYYCALLFAAYTLTDSKSRDWVIQLGLGNTIGAIKNKDKI